MYCLLWKTPPSMKSVKWYLVNLHFWVMMFDYTFGLLVIPYVLLPHLAGFPLGILQHFGVPTELQLIFLLICIAYVVNSIVAVFENRFHVVCIYPGKEYWKFWRRWWICAHYLVGSVAITSLCFLFPEQEAARKRVFEGLPCLHSYIGESDVFVASENIPYIAFLCIACGIMACGECLTFAAYLIYYTLHQFKSRRMSRNTFNIQRRFLMALIIQISVPMVTLIFPTIYGWFSIFTKYHNQALINIALTIGSLHGLCSTIVMLFVHQPYREAVYILFLETKMMRVSEKDVNAYRGCFDNFCLRC
ncbi:unnamed protein product [Caenorhabditis brenneri]